MPINRVITFELTQLIWARYINVTDGQTDSQTDELTSYHRNTAQCDIVYCTAKIKPLSNNIPLPSCKINNNRRMDLPEHRQKNDAVWHEMHVVAERWRLHAGIRPTFPTYDITCQMTYFRRVEGLSVLPGEESWRVRFRHRHAASGAFHYLSQLINQSKVICNARSIVHRARV